MWPQKPKQSSVGSKGREEEKEEKEQKQEQQQQQSDNIQCISNRWYYEGCDHFSGIKCENDIRL